WRMRAHGQCDATQPNVCRQEAVVLRLRSAAAPGSCAGTRSMSRESDTIVVVLMGVAGGGKSTVGRRLAAQLDWAFRDADELHPPTSIARMRAGLPLRNVDRAPWLRALAGLVASHVHAARPLVLACSALGRAHRQALLR